MFFIENLRKFGTNQTTYIFELKFGNALLLFIVATYVPLTMAI